MKISLVDVDGTGFPNLALMKISAYHKQRGDTVDWYSPMFSHPDVIYASKVFTWTADYTDYYVGDPEPIRGGTGYDIQSRLPEDMERMIPDYSIYPAVDYAIGFLSRGCIRRCPFCVVPRKEGEIREDRDITLVCMGFDGKRRHDVILMDNNFLANRLEYISDQVEKSVRLKLRLDFNQGLDARLMTEDHARILGRVRWLNYIRFACDSAAQVEPVVNAMRLMRGVGYRREFMVYFLAKDAAETYARIRAVMVGDGRVTPFVMPYRDLDGDGSDAVDEDVKHLARWANRVKIRKSCSFEQYKTKQTKTNSKGKGYAESFDCAGMV